MSARIRAILWVALAFAAVSMLIGAVNHWIIQPAFQQLERAQALEDSARARAAIQSELRQLGDKLGNWAEWDDAYAFAASRDPAFIASNLGDWRVLERSTRLNLCVILARDGEVLYRGGFSSEKGGAVMPAAFTGERPAILPLLEPVWRAGQSQAGLLGTELGPLLLTARPILTTAGAGPARGSLIFGLFLDPPLLAALAQQIQVAFEFFPAADPRLTPDERALLATLTPNAPALRSGARGGFVYEALADLSGQPVALLRTPVRQDISRTARHTSRTLVGALGLAALALLLGGAWWFTRVRGGAKATTAAAWGTATLATLIGLTLTTGLYWELRQHDLISPEDFVILLAGGLITLLLALYLFALVSQRQRAETLIAARTAELRSSEERYRIVALLTGQMLYDYDCANDHMQWVGAIETLTGHDAESFHVANLAAWVDLVHPEDRSRALERLDQARTAGMVYAVEYRLRRKDGSYFWAEDHGAFLLNHEGKACRMLGALKDITERQRAEAELRRRDVILQATADGMAHLLSGRGLQDSIGAALALLGAAVDADRVYVFENHSDPATGVPLMSQRYEWCAGGANPQIDNPELQNLSYESFSLRWRQTLAAGGVISGLVREFPESERLILEPQAIRSILVLPIRIEDHFWGFIGFDECRTDRVWMPVEETLLRTAAAAVGHAYVRQRAEMRQWLATAVFEAARDAIVVTDTVGKIIAVNPAFTTLTGYAEADARGRSPRFLWAERQADAYYEALWRTLTQEGGWQGEVWIQRKDGERRAVLTSLGAVKKGMDQVAHYVGVVTDITDLKTAEQRIEYLAYYDALTDLPNRALLVQQAELALGLAARHDTVLAVLLLDLDRFKDVNDSLGHAEGDTLLVQAAVRLRAMVRKSDTLCRLGGDEFVLLLPDGDQKGALRVADKVLAAFREPFSLAGHSLRVTVSVGIALYPHDGANFTELLKNADTALYQAKQDGRNTRAFYAPEMNVATFERLVLETELRQAIAAGQLCAHYQPQVRLRDGTLVGAEALVRWQHPDRGLIPPGRFIPVAEASDLIVELGDWMLAEVCRQLAAWREAGLPLLTVAVNLSARHFRDGELVGRLQSLLAAHDLSPRVLELELTESSLLETGSQTAQTLLALERLGVGLAIDDFGTGYSCLSYLKRLPLTALKIDQSFVRDLAGDPDDCTIAATITALGHSLGLKIVAEGVETGEQRGILLDQGCDRAQGYFFSRPLPAEAFAAGWLAPAREQLVGGSGVVGEGTELFEPIGAPGGT